jgi:hypothetical protein
VNDAVYVCENCGRLGPIHTFDDECKPGWTHGRLIKVESIYGAEPERATVLLFDADSAELIETNTLGQADYVITTGPLRYIDGEQHYPTKGTVIITLKQGRP